MGPKQLTTYFVKLFVKSNLQAKFDESFEVYVSYRTQLFLLSDILFYVHSCLLYFIFQFSEGYDSQL